MSETINLRQIGQVCYEANRAYSTTLGDTTRKPWADCTEEEKTRFSKGVAFRIQNPNAGPEAQHEVWRQDMLKDGWRLGTAKDVQKKLHPDLMPWSMLPTATKLKDVIFSSIVKAMVYGLETERTFSTGECNTTIRAGEKNDPSVEIGGVQAFSAEHKPLLKQLGFKEDGFGSWTYNSGGRLVCVNADGKTSIIDQVVTCAEAVGRRHQINQIKQALDIPFGVLTEEKAGEC